MTQIPTAEQLRQTNQQFYDSLWSEVRLIEAERFNTWPLMRALVSQARRRLEVAPGLRLRLPSAGSHFVDLSAAALAQLRRCGGYSVRGCITALPYADRSFDLVAALDILEHVEDDGGALAELVRVTAPQGRIVLSTPLHPQRWSVFDELVGHCRRYRPHELLDQLEGNGLVVEQSAVFGMQPRSNRLSELGMWYLTHQRARALWWYNRVIMPLALRFQRQLALQPGLIPMAEVDEILLICRRREVP